MNEGNQHPTAPQGDSNWHYAPTPDPQYANQHPAEIPAQSAYPQEVTWTASEFVAHEKGASWYAAFALGVTVLTVIVYLLTRDIISAFVVAALALLFGFSAVRKPRILTYQLNNSGIAIEQRFYPYTEFKSFSVLHEGAFSSITFMPLKRFMPPLSIYYASKDEELIFTILTSHLPFEEHSHDVIDRLARRLRF